MLGLHVMKSNDSVIIKWQLSKVEIPISDILDVSLDETYGGVEKEAIRIGTPYGTTDRVVIKTKTKTFILYTSNPTSIKREILS
ncbi:SunI/YnzG family protein [Virgibacillus sp. 6R]|uniref:SunI/YnzG family protein n=1 Tax=Metabacillus sp. 22489 TaxID=3453928 RepID=UPI0011A9FFE0